MNWLDYVLIFIFILNLYNGFRDGFIRQVVGLASFFIALYLSLCWSGDISNYLQSFLKLDQIIGALSKDGIPAIWLAEALLNIIAFLLVFSLVAFLLKIITKKLKILNKIPVIGAVNILLGGAFGIIKGFLVISLVVALISLIKTPFWSNTVEASVVVALSQHYLALLFNYVFHHVVDNLGQPV
ncbi:MAG: CvpA family protein [Firmicutes bacterium]|nr:CvpA family protein [Bacillota bacterium]